MTSGLKTMTASGEKDFTASSIGCGSEPARKSMNRGSTCGVGEVKEAARK
jgi:hypothetical protein